MKFKLVLLIFCFNTTLTIHAQEDNAEKQENVFIDGSNAVANQIKLERDIELDKLQDELIQNQQKLTDLTLQLSTISDNKYFKKIEIQEEIQQELDKRIRFLEESPKIKIKSNGQLAFTELIKIQKDIQPAKLYLSSNGFYSKLSKFDNLQDYAEFKDWKKEYDTWYKKKKGTSSTYDFIDKSLTLLTDTTNNIPLFGSISQTVTSGITIILSNIKGKNKELIKKTPKVLTLLNSIGQFEAEKSIIDNEWKIIDNDLKELQKEYKKLLDFQINFYGIDRLKYQNFLTATLDSDVEEFKLYSKEKILSKLGTLEKQNKPNWMGSVERYMYQVQSIRIRFGQLTSRMLTNIEQYETLFSKYNDANKFSSEFIKKAADLKVDLAEVKKNFVLTFNPNQYIEDSAIMYLKR